MPQGKLDFWRLESLGFPATPCPVPTYDGGWELRGMLSDDGRFLPVTSSHMAEHKFFGEVGDLTQK